MNDERFITADAVPFYLNPAVRATLPAKLQAARTELQACRACPRDCGVNRAADRVGYCRIGRHARVSSAAPHFGEEQCLRGLGGSGTILFSGCNLHCVFCQNWDISQQQGGRAMSPHELADTMLALQAAGCHNVNLVTPEHVVPQVVEALVVAIESGLRVPVVYNTSAYDALGSIALLDGLIDIYMPDFKFWSSTSAGRLCHAPDYPEHARAAIHEMHRQVGDLRVTPDGIACRGLLLRHLVMPGLVSSESAAIFAWLATQLSLDTYVNIMAQYRPENEVGLRHIGSDGTPAAQFADINRRTTAAELTSAYEAARSAGLWRFD